MGKQVHETWFEIAAKLMPSFGGAINAAKGKFNELGKVAQNVGKQFQNVKKWVLGVAGAAVAAIAAFGIGAVLKKAFGGAIDAATNYLIQNQKIGSILEANMRRHKVAPELIQANTKALMGSTEELGKQGVLGSGIYRQSLETLATYGRSPQEISKLMPVLGDVLVGTKGINASTEDMAGLSTAVGKAIQGGPLKALGQYNIDLSKMTAKQWKSMSIQGRMNWLTKQWGVYAGENAKQAETDLGAIRQMNNAVGGLSRRIGLHLLPAQASLARFWTAILPDISGLVLPAIGWVSDAIKGLADRAREAYPQVRQAAIDFALKPEVQDAWNKIGDALNRIGAVVGPLVLPFLTKIGEAIGSWALDVAVRGLQQLATDLEKLASFVEWASKIENVNKAFDDFGVSVQNAMQQVPVIKDVIPEDYGTNLANNLKTEWAGLQTFIADPVKFMKQEWTSFEADSKGIIERIKQNAQTSLSEPFAIPGIDWGGLWDEAVSEASAAWEAISGAFTGAEAWLETSVVEPVRAKFQEAWDGAKQIWSDVTGIFADTAGQIGSALAAVTEALKKPFLDAIAAIKAAWDQLVGAITGFKMPDIIGGVKAGWSRLTGGKGGEAPATQLGGIFSSPQVRSIAEAGPEAVIPMERTGRAQGLLARAAGAIGELGKAHSMNIGGATMNFAPVINVGGPATPEAIGQMQQNLRRIADEFMSRLGEFENRERRLAFE